MLFFIFLLTLISVIVVQWIRGRQRKFSLREKIGLSGPPTDFFTGNVADIIRYQKKEGLARTPYMRIEMESVYGKTFGWYFGDRLQITSNDVDFAREVFVAQFQNFVDRETIALSDTFPMVDGLLQIGGVGKHSVGWKDVRSVVTPIFTSGKMKKMHSTIAERVDACMETFERRIKDSGGYFDIYDEWQSLTLDTIARCAFGVECDSLNNKEDSFYVNCRKFFNAHSLEQSPIPFLLSFMFPLIGPYLRSWSAVGAAERPLTDRLRETVEKRKKEFESYEGVDLIQLLLQQDEERQKNENKSPLSDDVIISNCYSFLLAGYETTSTALAFCTWLLAKYPEEQKKLHEEVLDIFGNEEIDYEHVMRAPFIDCVFRETLRVMPPVVFFTARTCVKDTVVCGYSVPAGTAVCIPVHCIHWDEENWTDAMKFIPDRFLDPEARKKAAWLPFGIGPRNCVGMRFAEMEFKTAIASSVRRFKFELKDPEEELDVRISTVLLRPLNGVKLIVSERK